MTVSKYGNRWYIGDDDGNSIGISEEDARALVIILNEDE